MLFIHGDDLLSGGLDVSSVSLMFSQVFFNFLMRVSVQGRMTCGHTHANSDKGRKTESWQLQVLIQMINVTKEITRHRLM